MLGLAIDEPNRINAKWVINTNQVQLGTDF
ncbi:MAG: hypothetical protein ACJARX_001562 [Psychroserpens sp.]|jgi:hypothetical protein